MTLERSLQALIESNLDEMLGIRFLATEHSTGAKHGGRIDTLGLDENDCPVIIEYKRAVSENVINQGLFYLDWLNDHQADFRWLVMEKLGKAVAESIDWSGTRLCASQAISRSTTSTPFSRYPGTSNCCDSASSVTTCSCWRWRGVINRRTCHRQLRIRPCLRNRPTCRNLPRGCWRKRAKLFATHTMRSRPEALALGDEVILNERKLYFAFRRVKNFACVEVRPSAGTLLVYLNLDPTAVEFEEGFTRDVSSIGHWGTGDVEVVLREPTDIVRALPLLTRSFENS